MKKCITNPLANIPVNVKSHSFGWANQWSELLNADIDHKCSNNIKTYDIIYIDHGVNFTGSLNLFGGLSEDIYNKFNNLIACKNIISLDHEMPDYGAMFLQRLHAKSTFNKINLDWCHEVSRLCRSINKININDIDYQGVTIGDSHSIAFSKKKDLILKMDGKTLYGQLGIPFINYLNDIDLDKVKRITMCFGSIDVRHHILRKNIDVTALLLPYIEKCKELQYITNIPVEIAVPVPVEYEDRRIPKTGYYKGQPFYGSIQERQNITAFIIKLLKDNHDKVVTPPMSWYFMDPEEYAKTKMELNSSVHIAPVNYRRNNWGINV